MDDKNKKSPSMRNNSGQSFKERYEDSVKGKDQNVKNDALAVKSSMEENLRQEVNQSSSDSKAADAANDQSSELDSYKAKFEMQIRILQEALADSENHKKSVIKRAEDSAKYAVSAFVTQITEVVEILIIALKSVNSIDDISDEQFKKFYTGVKMTMEEIYKIFDKNSIVRIDPLGEKFDPNTQQAVSQIESEGEEGIVVQVFKAGYSLHGRILKSAMVAVSTKTVS